MKCLRILSAILLALCLSFQYAQAQTGSSMTDKQVKEYIIREHNKGTSPQQIITKLVEKGVPVDQLRRVKKDLEKEQAKKQDNTFGTKAPVRSDDSSETLRQRKPNGDKKDESLSAMEEASRKKNSSELFDFEDEAWEQLDSIPQKKNIKRVIFGHDIFNNKKLTFEPEMNIATPSDYKLGPGDAVFIDIWGASQKSISSTVSPEGEIDIEGFGPIQVSGLTVAQANSRLKATIGSRYSGSNIKLSVGQTKTISVNVMGAVETPGTYTLSAFSTVFHALYMAGGVSEIGSLRDIRVFRNGRQISTVDIYDYILNGKLSGNIKLSSGDIIIVNPYECLVNITGKIKRPMFYEMKKNESVATLLKYAGGFAGDAYTKNLRLVRKAGGVKSVYTIDEFERTSFQLMDEDSVFVDSTLNRYSNMVEIKGAVFRPGMYQVDGNISTVRQLIERAGGMTEDAVTTRGIMHRMTKERSLQAVSLDLKGIMEHTSPDVSLQNEDVIYIPSNRERKLQRFLKIAGEVQHPGEFDYAEGTTLEDLILRAGGLTDAASLIKIEVSRRIRNASATKAPLFVAKTYSFEMKDGFVVTGEPGFVLEPYDEIYVRKSPGYVGQEHVLVDGEVAFAGTYVLTRKNYRLSDLINAAGGINEQAYIGGAKLIRKMSEEEKKRYQTILTGALKNDSLTSKLQVGDERYIGIDLAGAIAHPGSELWDVVLQDGDHLIIPQQNNTVSINGEVLYPNTVTYKDGVSLDYYIDQAGGYGEKARKKRVFAIQMNGTVTRVKSAKDILPGCEIIVPMKKEYKRMTFSEIMSLGSIIATLGAVIATLVK